MIRCTRSAAAPFVAGILVVSLSGCGGGGNGPAEPEAGTSPTWTYTVRGIVTALPDEIAPRRLYVRHEAIEDFRVDDRIVGMASMVMPFELAPDIDIAGLAVGDKVAFEWQVGGDSPSGRVTRLERLPYDEDLVLDGGPGSARATDTDPDR